MRTAKIIGPDLRLEKLGISLVKVYELVGKSVTLVMKRTKMANTCILWLWIWGKVEKTSWFCALCTSRNGLSGLKTR